MHERQTYQKQLARFAGAPVVKVITGMRRVGKSSLLKLLRDEQKDLGGGSPKIISIDMELMEFASIQSDTSLYEYVRSQLDTDSGHIAAPGRQPLLIIDEIQEVPRWEKAINALLNEGNLDITITGSNAGLLSSELATLLTGRYVEIPVFPLTYQEYATFKNQEPNDQLFTEFVRRGGMPGIHKMTQDDDTVNQYLASLLDSIVLKDIVTRFAVRDVDLLRRILSFMAANSANTFSARRVAEFMKSQRRSLSIETVYNYVSYVVSAYLAYRIPRYDIKGKRHLEVHEKYIFGDLGLKHSLVGYRPSDINTALESVVYFELRKRGYSVSVGALGVTEIDFIAEKAGQRLYVQVCYLLSDDSVVQREFGPLEAIRDNYPKMVLSMDRLGGGNKNGIEHMYLPDFLTSGDK